MQHHIDEFSVSDIRYTLGEVWRVVTNRRWHFVIPFCAVATIAFIASLWAPRTYTATTIIKREHDPVLASMMGRSWTEPYAEIRQRMAADISSPTLVNDVLEELNLASGQVVGSANSSGLGHHDVISPADEAARRELARSVSAGLRVAAVESSPNRDVVQITLGMSDPTHLKQILAACRDRYVDFAKKRTSEVLGDVQRFFMAESERCRSKLSGLEKQLIEMETTYPGIDPSTTDPSQAEQSALVVERLELGRKQDDLMAQRLRLQAYIESGCGDGGDRQFAVMDASGIPNPRIPELESELAKLQQELHESRTVRLMTEEHPTVIRLLKTIEARQAELASAPLMVTESGLDGARSVGTETLSEADRAAAKIQDIEQNLMAISGRLTEIGQMTATIDRRRVATADHREAYLKLRQQSDQLREELNGWQANIGPIGHILAVESSNRGIHFTTLQEAMVAPKPTSPHGFMVVAICLAIGVGVGSIVVLLTELLDRSFQTVRQLNSSLGIPVIESIDEILTEPARRRLILRRFVVMPAVTFGLGLLMTITGTMAYMSLEHPDRYDQMRRLVGMG